MKQSYCVKCKEPRNEKEEIITIKTNGFVRKMKRFFCEKCKCFMYSKEIKNNE